MKLLFVVNKISGGKNKTDFLKASANYCDRYGIEVTLFYTSGENDVLKLKKSIEVNNPDRVVSVGGDGTTMLTALGLKGSCIPFGIIPMGSANGMAKELEVPLELMKAFEDIVSSQIIVSLDIVKVNNDYTIHLGDVGINAVMVERFSKEKGRGWAGYAKHFFEAVTEAELMSFEIEINGERELHKAYSIIIANTRMYGTGAVVNPEGNPHDGKFELVLVLNKDWKGLFTLGLSTLKNEVDDTIYERVKVLSCESAVVKFTRPQLLQLDGEVIGDVESLNISIEEEKVNFISTKDNSFVSQT